MGYWYEQHYNDVTWVSWRLNSPAKWLFAQRFLPANNKENNITIIIVEKKPKSKVYIPLKDNKFIFGIVL